MTVTEKNIKTTVINFIDDQRYSEKMLSNHDQIMIPCIQSRTLSQIEENSIHDVILINEAQFFEDLYDFVLTHLDKNKKIYLWIGW